jgi:hypothetical protein
MMDQASAKRRQTDARSAVVPRDGRGHSEASRRHRFPKGRSGNPRGRRKGSRNLLGVFKEVVMKKIKIPVSGKLRKMTMAEYVFRMNYQAALRRNQQAKGNILMLAQVAGHLINQEDLKRIGVPIAQAQSLTLDQFEAMFGGPSEMTTAPSGKPPKN